MPLLAQARGDRTRTCDPWSRPVRPLMSSLPARRPRLPLQGQWRLRIFELATANGVFEGTQEAVENAIELLRSLRPSQRFTRYLVGEPLSSEMAPAADEQAAA